jgi:hypothetical protein
MKVPNGALRRVVLITAVAAVTSALAVRTTPSASPHVSVVHDWSNHHIIYGNSDLPTLALLARRDPRALSNWIHRNSHLLRPRHTGPYIRPTQDKNSRIDWAMSLGAKGGMPVGETPAKFTFDITKPPSCQNDFVVFVVNATPSVGGQANIVAFNNLYSGPAPNSCGTNPTFLWSYAVGSGPVYLSPVLSEDGTKVAFLESASNGQIMFHVLTWVAGQGTNATTGAVAPGSGGSSVTSLSYTNVTAPGCAISPATASNASPYIDYAGDAAYVAADNGNLYRISPVFKAGTPAVQYCITVSANAALTSPVFDAQSGKVFISDGQKVYAFAAGATGFAAAGSIQIASTANSVILSPIVDSTNGFVYVFANHNVGNTNAIVSQMPFLLNSHADAAIGPVTTGYVLDGQFDNNYFNTGPSAGSLYACGTQPGAATKPSLYTLSFNSLGVLNSTPAMSNDIHLNSSTNPAGTCSPLLELFDGTNDRLFVGVGQQGSTSGANMVSMWNINTRITSNATLPAATATNYLGGTSAFSMDNFSTIPQASSVYFGDLFTGTAAHCGSNLYCAVKLTQSALQ